MSLAVDQFLPAREVGHSNKNQEQSYPESLRDESQEHIYSSPDDKYHDYTIFDNFYSTEDKSQPAPEAPALPQRSSLRASRLLDDISLKLGPSIDSTELPQATPLDMYLSSEEDVSSSADDFSDYGDNYGYDSSNEDPQSPIRRTSYEVMARAVSVVFSGKPSIIELPTPRRSISPNSIGSSKRSSMYSSISAIERSSTPTGSISSLHQPTRTSTLVSSFLPLRRKPPFLNIDPYANGSTYSLEILKENNGDEAAPKTPRTPTALLRGASRTFSLVRKRSRPLLNNFAAVASRDNMTSPAPSLTQPREVQEETRRAPELPQSPQSPQSPITYNDIIKAARKNAMVSPPHPSPTHQQQSPLASPTTGPKRGILSGLAARRRSIKLTGRLI
ncbi:hypothetical protein QBC33DRAFT_560135 [Phialemonium atrogriseum]|uniref:Uncharacterized protein n=1 Tax=Phialemonium atrogriseum TaxID=1093897 RepID=A0AAJ0FKB1_9PEZI|nr:uncharacterized protein QBC33DRAFT_560135 [Phialemonium atrogriseum]KAK1766228.1 hypothetical protein QBC33DRAFT_560135 [Phialemonium atrogriseum]